jgi:DinB superfamily
MEGGRETAAGLVARNYAIVHERVLKVVDELSDEQFGKPLHRSVHSIGWQVWHIARWEDRFAEILLENLPELAQRHGARHQIWTSESLGERWGLPVGTMGLRDTGTSMDDEAADRVELPAKAEVVDYARRVFALVDELASSLPDDVLLSVMPGDPDRDSTGQNVMIYLEHVSRHLGMIEAMKGQQGLTGSSTR